MVEGKLRERVVVAASVAVLAAVIVAVQGVMRMDEEGQQLLPLVLMVRKWEVWLLLLLYLQKVLVVVAPV